MLIEELERLRDDRFYRHERLALAKAIVNPVSNLHFGPEVGVGPAKSDSPVIAPWLSCVESMAADIEGLKERKDIPAEVVHGDSRRIAALIPPQSVDAVITSPPYPNEKDYTRTPRLESVLLGFIQSKGKLQEFKRTLMRSNTRNVYRGDDDDGWVAKFPQIQQVAEEIERRRVAMGKTSGFERMYAKVTRLYFGGMARHLSDLQTVLRPGARLAYVVGDQASYLRVMIRTGQILADIAASLGYRVLGIDLFRSRFSTTTGDYLREEVLVLEWPGTAGGSKEGA